MSAADASDRGSATVWVALMAGALCAVFGAVLMLGQVVSARHRAGAAADLAALAAADHALDGPGAACAYATRVAAAQGARVARCAVLGEVSDVTAEVAVGLRIPPAQVRARAGPPTAGPCRGSPSPDSVREAPPPPCDRTHGGHSPNLRPGGTPTQR